MIFLAKALDSARAAEERQALDDFVNSSNLVSSDVAAIKGFLSGYRAGRRAEEARWMELEEGFHEADLY